VIELLPLSVGVGLAVSLLFTELFGIASAGMVVPGYLALSLHNPGNLVATLAVALLTFAIVRVLGTFMIIYGRRRIALMILIGYMLGMLVQQWSGIWIQDFAVIGFIIPGLIAIWMDRQGMFETLASLAIVAVVVRLILILVVGVELMA
jgi:poly-gamma-glutamate biosynthesis protein PgsC/CapC